MYSGQELCRIFEAAGEQQFEAYVSGVGTYPVTAPHGKSRTRE
ncbi:hypothetical protein HMPREF0322_01510 [Desulfitobacterium hafniense DP7]|uniref:Uncharacterized protein n=1 Tax=Desulfitobacterium hafniense DP7 TaxID=537010 RepID=G9XKM7_DESHA|nr:hypothetical protein HMPREF0322_01510 [Desulfitobacterium hafniense DP7]